MSGGTPADAGFLPAAPLERDAAGATLCEHHALALIIARCRDQAIRLGLPLLASMLDRAGEVVDRDILATARRPGVDKPLQ